MTRRRMARLPGREPLFPAARLAREPCREGWLRVARRLRLAGRFGDLLFEVFVVRQSRQLVDEHQRVLRRDFKFLSARLADHLVVDAQQVVTQLRELRAIFIRRAGGQPVLLRSAHPADGVVTGPPALGARVSSLPRLGLFVEECAFVEGHASMLSRDAYRRPPRWVNRDELSSGLIDERFL